MGQAFSARGGARQSGEGEDFNKADHAATTVI
jgi:hypothetical protein